MELMADTPCNRKVLKACCTQSLANPLVSSSPCFVPSKGNLHHTQPPNTYFTHLPKIKLLLLTNLLLTILSSVTARTRIRVSGYMDILDSETGVDVLRKCLVKR